jgi:hypothetical protein
LTDSNHRQALRLIDAITQCAEVEAVWKAASDHPCRKVVETQNSDPTVFQVPEPWAGHLHSAPILLVSSNPSISADEPYPTWNDPPERRVQFFDQRFGDGPGQVRDGVRFPLKEQAPDGSWHSRRPVAFLARLSSQRLIPSGSARPSWGRLRNDRGRPLQESWREGSTPGYGFLPEPQGRHCSRPPRRRGR